MSKKLEKTIKSIKNHSKIVKKSNEAFEKMSAGEKRVVIAEDVIKALKAKKIVASGGTWFNAEVPLKSTSGDLQLQKVLAEIPSCDVCAVGGLFVCAVKRFNKLKVEQVSCFTDDLPGVPYCANGDNEQAEEAEDCTIDADIEDLQPYLERFFTKNQLALIEAAFEQRTSEDNYTIDDNTVRESQFDQAGESYDFIVGDHERMIEIMKNIIKNKGTFVPLKDEEIEKLDNKYNKQ